VVAVYENPAIRDLRVELERYPEIQEAIRTERPVIIHDVREHPLFDTIRRHWVQQAIEVNVQSAVALPVFVQGRAAGVFSPGTVTGDPRLRPQDVAFANTIAQAAARVLENEERRAAIYRRQISAGVTDVLTGCASLDALDRRLRDEFERARRYALRFVVVVIDVDRLRDINERLGQPAGDRGRKISSRRSKPRSTAGRKASPIGSACRRIDSVAKLRHEQTSRRTVAGLTSLRDDFARRLCVTPHAYRWLFSQLTGSSAIPP